MNRNFAGPARIVNLLLGIWLIFSAYGWPHEPQQQAVTAILGVLIAVIGFLAVRLWSGFRFANTVLAVLLFVSVFVLHHAAVTTVVNNTFVAAVVFLVSLIGPTREAVAPTQHAEARLPPSERGFPPPQNPRTA